MSSFKWVRVRSVEGGGRRLCNRWHSWRAKDQDGSVHTPACCEFMLCEGSRIWRREQCGEQDCCFEWY